MVDCADSILECEHRVILMNKRDQAFTFSEPQLPSLLARQAFELGYAAVLVEAHEVEHAAPFKGFFFVRQKGLLGFCLKKLRQASADGRELGLVFGLKPLPKKVTTRLIVH